MHEGYGKCEINHLKPSGVMESPGAVEMFRHSIEKYGLVHNRYVGDGGIIYYRFCK